VTTASPKLPGQQQLRIPLSPKGIQISEELGVEGLVNKMQLFHKNITFGNCIFLYRSSSTYSHFKEYLFGYSFLSFIFCEDGA
jgi:hypothetical protein